MRTIHKVVATAAFAVAVTGLVAGPAQAASGADGLTPDGTRVTSVVPDGTRVTGESPDGTRVTGGSPDGTRVTGVDPCPGSVDVGLDCSPR